MREAIAFISDIGGVVAFAVLLATAGWTAYRYLKRKRISIPKQLVLALVLHGVVVYLVHMNTDTPGVSATVSILIGVLVNLLGDAYGEMIADTQKMAKEAVAEARTVAEGAVTVAERVAVQNKELVKIIEKLTGQSFLEEEDES